MAATKKAPTKKASVKKVPAKKTPAKRAAHQPATKKAAVSRAANQSGAGKSAAKHAPAKRAAAKPAAAKKSQAKKAPTATRPAKKAAAATATKAAAKKSGATKPAARGMSTFGASSNSFHLPEPRGVSKDGIAYTKDFDVKFLKAQRDLLAEEKAKLLGQATRLENEANSLIEEAEMGDVQFDDEGGEGDTMVVERERDLALSAQARQTIADIDEALERLAKGTYGYSEASGRPIPRERLEAIPWATELVEEKVGGIGRR
jgi:RNA polymerase-binding transcription factor DksA